MLILFYLYVKRYLDTMSHISLECVYTQWSEWSHCSKSCDNGRRERTREVIGDVTCDMLTFESETCNTECCPGMYFLKTIFVGCFFNLMNSFIKLLR